MQLSRTEHGHFFSAHHLVDGHEPSQEHTFFVREAIQLSFQLEALVLQKLESLQTVRPKVQLVEPASKFYTSLPAEAASSGQTLRAVSTTNRNLAHWSSSVSRFPSAVDAKPHCGLRARFSRGT